jgi:hypothetical protein
MSAKHILIGTIAGGGTVFLTGVALFAAPPLREFYRYAMNAGAATGVPRESPLLWAVLLGALSYGALVTLAIGNRTSPVSIGSGIRTGAVVGFLLWFTANFMFFGVSHVGSLATTTLDPLLELVPGAAAGGIVAAILGKVGGPPRASQVHHG